MNMAVVDRLGDRVHVGITGQQDTQGAGKALIDLRQQGGAIHARHTCIADHQVDWALFKQFKGLRTTFSQ
ncbi:hypothetical protein D3C84_1271380 [compost metagenome]